MIRRKSVKSRGEICLATLFLVSIVLLSSSQVLFAQRERVAVVSGCNGEVKIQHNGVWNFVTRVGNRISAAISSLGGNISITNDTMDSGFANATVANGQIRSKILTDGVDQFNYAVSSSITVDSAVTKVMLGRDQSSVMMAFESVRNGSILVMTDKNPWNNVELSSNDNNVLFQNMLTEETSGLLKKKLVFSKAGDRLITFNYNFVTIDNGDDGSNIKVHLHKSDNTTETLSLTLSVLSSVSGLATSLISSSTGFQTGCQLFSTILSDVPAGDTILEFHVENDGDNVKKNVLLLDNVVDPLVESYDETPATSTDYLLTFARMMRDNIDVHSEDETDQLGCLTFVDDVIDNAASDPNVLSIKDWFDVLSAARNNLI